MSIEKSTFGTLADGRAVTRYRLARGGISADILDYGAVIHRLFAPDRDGKTVDIVLGFEELDDYTVNVPSFGAAVGRLVGPVPDLALRVGDKIVIVEPSNDEGTHMHGGRIGFTRTLWQAEACNEASSDVLRLSATFPDGQDGYPGELRATITYRLDAAACLTVEYTGETDRPTPLNPTNHSYFNLAGHNNGTVKKQVVKLYHSQVMVGGVPMPPGSTPFDLREARALGEALDSGDPRMAGGYDNFHLIAGQGFRPVLEAWDPVSGRTLRIDSDATGTIFYSGNYLFDYPGKDGAVYGKSTGFACEPCFVEAKAPFNPSHVPLVGPVIPFRSVTRYTFGASVVPPFGTSA